MNDFSNPIFPDETKARKWLEARLWPDAVGAAARPPSVSELVLGSGDDPHDPKQRLTVGKGFRFCRQAGIRDFVMYFCLRRPVWIELGGEWSAGPDDGYYFQRLPWHLAQAGEAGALRDLLFNFRWLSAKLGAVGPALLLSDYDELVIDGEQGVLMADTLRLSSHVLAGKVASPIGSFLAPKRTWVACASLPASCWLSKLMQRCMRHATPVRCTSGCLNRRG